MRSMCLGDRRCCHSDGSSSATNQQAVPFLKTKSPEERSPGGLKHFRHCTEHFPRQLDVNDLNFACGNTGVFGIAAIELPAHSSHAGCNHVALLELTAWSMFNESDRFNAEDARKMNAWGMTLPGEKFRAIQSKGHDPD